MRIVRSRGDTIPFVLDQIKDETGALVTSLTGWSFRFTLKAPTDVANNDTAALVAKSSSGGTMTISGTKVTWDISSAESDGLSEGVEYIYDVQSKTPAGRVFTEDNGTVRITRDVTRSTT